MPDRSSRPRSLPRRVARRVVLAMQRWTSRDYGPAFAKVHRRDDELEASIRGLGHRDDGLETSIRDLGQRGDGLEAAIRNLEVQFRQFCQSATTQLEEVDGYRAARVQQMDRQHKLTQQFLSSLGGLAGRVDAAQSDIGQLSARCASIEAQAREVQAVAAGATAAESHRALEVAVGVIRERQDGLSRFLSDRSLAWDGVRRDLDRLRSGEPDAAVPAAGCDGRPDRQRDHRLDQLYLQFEDLARGSRDEIKLRQSAYLPLVREVGAGTAERPVLDLGAGRGEWLELLREAGLQARGVDVNRAMVAVCQGFGLDCAEGDAVAELRGLPSNSLGLVSGFHVIEHLSFEGFVDVLDEVRRVLAPGGAVLFETPDPGNVLVGSHTFYIDPTHRNPMPSTMTRIVAEARGLTEVEIRRLHPGTERFPGQDRELIDRLDALFFGPRDYAVIARKP